VTNAASKVRPCLRGFSIIWRGSQWTPQRVITTLFDAAIQADLVEDVVGLLFGQASSVQIEALDDAIITPGSISRGRSVVLRAWKADRLQPVVIKLAPTDNILQEVANYRTTVHGNLHGHFHSILEGEPEARWDIGGICYSFLGAPTKGPEKFATRFRRTEDPAELILPLNHFFGEVWQPLYADTRALHGTLFEAYDGALGLTTRLQSYSDMADKLSFPGVTLPLPNPIAWLTRHAEASRLPMMRQARTHGDLHGDNLFVSDRYGWVIDFGRTGWGHILRDFVELEVDIITRLVEWPDNSLAHLFQVVSFLADENQENPPQIVAHFPPIQQTLLLIRELRQLAKNVTRYVDFREYLWGLLLDAVFVATFDVDNQDCAAQQEKALLMAAVITIRLQHGSDRWPLDNWSE
jgi:hypothetical protein